MEMALRSCRVETGTYLQHVSRTKYRGQPLHFGRDGANRYDDPARIYGVLYLAVDLPTALMESVFHEHQWADRRSRVISLAEVDRRLVRCIGLKEGLVLADLTSPGVMSGVLGLNLEQLSSRNYRYTQQVSANVHGLSDTAGRASFDGLLYPSRNNYPASSVGLFDRARRKIQVVDDIELPDHVDWPSFVTAYSIGISPASVDTLSG